MPGVRVTPGAPISFPPRITPYLLQCELGDLCSLREEHGRHEKQECLCVPARRRPKGVGEIVGWMAQLGLTIPASLLQRADQVIE